MYSTTLSGGSKLKLAQGKGWQDAFLETIVLPFINGDLPPDSKKIASSRTADCWSVPAGGSSLFIKFFHFRHFTDRFHIVRKTRARRAWEGGILLEKKGFLTPDLIAQGDVVKHFCIQKSFLITRFISPSVRLLDYINTDTLRSQTAESTAAKRVFVAGLGRLIGRLHKAGIVHGDLRTGNILVMHSGATPLFYFIDNERNRYFDKGIPARLREKNLVQISMVLLPQITFTDRLRFFRAYMGENPELKPQTKEWIRRIFMKTRKRLQKKLPSLWN